MNRTILNILLLLLLNPLSSYCQSNYWTLTNGPHAGTINDYSFGDNNIVYAAADNGVYKSTDNGENWNNMGIAGVQIWGICKTSSGALLAGIYGNGINRTTNEGQTWIQTTSTASYIYDIKEINPNLIIFATSSGVYKSTNIGLSWILCLNVVNANSIDASSNNEIYLSSANSGIYKSTNFGENWTYLSGFNFGQASSINVAINGYIFVTTWNGEIFRSTDNGISFENLTNITPIYKTSFCFNYLRWAFILRHFLSGDLAFVRFRKYLD